MLSSRTIVRMPSHASSHRSIVCNDEDSRSMVSGRTSPINTPIAAPLLPNEVIDLILDALFTCTVHPWATRHAPCTAWHYIDAASGTSNKTKHTPNMLTQLFPLRLVNRSFHTRLTPILFYHMTCRAPKHRHRMLIHFSNKPHLTPLIKVLRFDIDPADLGGRMRRVTQQLGVSSYAKLMHYFEVLRIVLVPLLKKFHALQTLHVTTSYDGIPDKRLPKLEVLPHCFDALVDSIRRAQLEDLEAVTLGMPYEGGWTNFFEDLEDSRYKTGLRKCGRNIRTASVKLFDHQGNFTTMPFF